MIAALGNVVLSAFVLFGLILAASATRGIVTQGPGHYGAGVFFVLLGLWFAAAPIVYRAKASLAWSLAFILPPLCFGMFGGLVMVMAIASL